MKIGLLIDSLIGGGAERVTLNLFNAFSELGYEPHIFLVINKIEHHLDDIPSGRLHSLSESGVFVKNKVFNKLMLAYKLRSVIRLIEKHDNEKFLFFISSAEDMDRLTRIAKVPNVYIRYRNSMWIYMQGKIGSKTGLKANYKRWRFTRKFRSIYSGRDIITVSNALHDDIINKVGVKPRSIKTIYNPFNFKLLNIKASESADFPGEPYILYAARIENRKNQELLIRAYHKANPKHLLVLIGGTYTESDKRELLMLKNLIQSLDISDKVIFAGFQSNPYPWIKNASLFAMSSNSEGLPTVLIESLILNTPVVSTDCPTGPSEILTGEFAQFLSPVGDIEALAKNITSAISNYPEIDEKIISKYHHLGVAKQYIEYATS